MDKEEDLQSLLERAKEVKEIGEKLMKEPHQLMGEYKTQKLSEPTFPYHEARQLGMVRAFRSRSQYGLLL